jgi:hypothetical protein
MNPNCFMHLWSIVDGQFWDCIPFCACVQYLEFDVVMKFIQLSMVYQLLFLFFLTAKRWLDDNAHRGAWNNSCSAYLGCFPSCTGMTLPKQILCSVSYCFSEVMPYLLWVLLHNFFHPLQAAVCLIYTISEIAESLQNEESSSRDWSSAGSGEADFRVD